MIHAKDTKALRRTIDLVLALAGIGFIVSAGILGYQYIQVNRSGFEERVWPPTEDWTFRNWRKEENGHWSAEVYFYKARPECIYLKDQIVSVLFTNTLGEIGESSIAFIGDVSPGNSRPDGWQRIDTRVEMLNPKIDSGTIIRGMFLHKCHEGLPTVSGFRGIVVGKEMPWPKYVKEWIASGRKGTPSDYRHGLVPFL